MLESLKFTHSFTKINSFTFSSLDNLEKIDFSKNKIETISENAFSFDLASNKSLILKFITKDTNDFGLNEKSFLNINRPTKLILETFAQSESGCHLNETIYLPFLLDNPNNTIDICFGKLFDSSVGCIFNCSDLGNLWLYSNNENTQRVQHCNANFEIFPMLK